MAAAWQPAALPPHCCQVCAAAPAPLACPGCACMFYCGQAHRRRHWDQLGHAEECGRMAAAAARRQELAGHPMPWAAATHQLPPCAWLARLGLHAGASQPAGTSAWQRECPCGGPEAAPWGAAAPLLHQLWAGGSSEADGTGAAVPAAVLSRTELLIELGDWLRLPPAHAPCLLSQSPASAPPPADWASYYRLRGLPLASPAALLLDATLTLHAAVVRLHRQLLRLQGSCSAGGAAGCGDEAAAQPQQPLQGLPALLPGGRLELHLLGPQRELDQWPLLLELGSLLPPGLRTELHLIGPDVPPAWHGRALHVAGPAPGACGRPACSCAAAAAQATAQAAIEEQQQQAVAGSMTLLFWRGAWHELAPELAAKHGAPHAVVAPNAGLAAYLSWVPTLQRLLAGLGCGASGTSGAPGSAAAAGSGAADADAAAAGAGPLVCCFTDYNEEAVHRAAQLVEHLAGAPAGSSGGSGSPAAAGVAVEAGALHPFRQPAAVLAADHALPSASNGFALWLERSCQK